jgi:hypothetical protein
MCIYICIYIYIHYRYMFKTKEILKVNKGENTFDKTKYDTYTLSILKWTKQNL